jgi:hypothetical protein
LSPLDRPHLRQRHLLSRSMWAGCDRFSENSHAKFEEFPTWNKDSLLFIL